MRMHTSNDTPQQSTTQPPLVSVVDFIKNHNPPISLRWAIQKHRREMLQSGAICQFGRKILVSPDRFWNWLRDPDRDQVV